MTTAVKASETGSDCPSDIVHLREVIFKPTAFKDILMFQWGKGD